MVQIYQFSEHSLCVSGEKGDLLALAAYLREAEGTIGDLRYQIEYAFDVDGVGLPIWKNQITTKQIMSKDF